MAAELSTYGEMMRVSERDRRGFGISCIFSLHYNSPSPLLASNILDAISSWPAFYYWHDHRRCWSVLPLLENIFLLECCTWKVHCRKIACTKLPLTWQSYVRGHAMLSFVEVWENLGWTCPSDNFLYRFIPASSYSSSAGLSARVIIEFFSRPSLIGKSTDPRLGIYERHSSDGSLFDSYCSRDKQARISV